MVAAAVVPGSMTTDAWLQRGIDIHSSVMTLRHEWAADGYMIESEPCLLGPRALEPTYVFYNPSRSLRILVIIPNLASRISSMVHSVAAAGGQTLVLLVRVRTTAQKLKASLTATCAQHPQGCDNALGVHVDTRAIEDLLGRTRASEVGPS